MATVYGLYNRTKEERYYGVTTRQNVKRMKQLASVQTRALEHWDFSKDDITVKIVTRRLSQENAIARVYELELRKSRTGWKTIQTGGKWVPYFTLGEGGHRWQIEKRTERGPIVTL